MNSLKARKVTFDDSYLSVELEDGRIIRTPLEWYPELKKATIDQIKNWKLICRGTGIEWEDLDFHLSVESMLVGQLKSEKPVA